MKKRFRLMMAAVLLAGLPFAKPLTKVKAEEDPYPLACTAFEVDVVSTSDEKPVFTKTDCYNSFDEAKSAMKSAGNNAVVRHVNSLSPMKIIAMNSGLGYSYPGRSGKGTETITHISLSNASTYMPSGREMYYLDTLSYNPEKGTGKVEVEVTGFHGTAELKDMDLIPMAWVQSNAWLWMGGKNTYSNERTFQHRIQISFYKVEQNGKYKDLVFYAWNNKGYSVFNRAVGPAADWMKSGDVYYSSDDVNFYWDEQHHNKAGTYYNFYEFVPLRSKSSIPVEKYNAFLTSKKYNSSSKLWDSGQYFLDDQEYYGMNAAMVFAQACCESAYGTSNFAKNRNNLFGVNAVDSNPNQADTFESVKTGIDLQMGYLLRGYMADNDWRFYGTSFGNKGTGITVKYASSIYYGITLGAIYYDFDKFANDYNGSLTDYNSISYGLVNGPDAWVYTSSDGSGKRIHNYQNKNNYQQNSTVTILGTSGDYYAIISQNYLNDDGSKMKISGTSAPAWDWKKDVLYIKKSDVTILKDNGITAYDPANSDQKVSPVTPEPEPQVQNVTVYRLYNPYDGEHLFTTSSDEYAHLGSVGWTQEGEVWKSPETGSTPVYRLYNQYEGTHIYTTKKEEYDSLVKAGWTGEDAAFYSADESGTPVYRMFNPYSENGLHLFTTSLEEYEHNAELGWEKEDIEFYGITQ